MPLAGEDMKAAEKRLPERQESCTDQQQSVNNWCCEHAAIWACICLLIKKFIDNECCEHAAIQAGTCRWQGKTWRK